MIYLNVIPLRNASPETLFTIPRFYTIMLTVSSIYRC